MPPTPRQQNATARSSTTPYPTTKPPSKSSSNIPPSSSATGKPKHGQSSKYFHHDENQQGAPTGTSPLASSEKKRKKRKKQRSRSNTATLPDNGPARSPESVMAISTPGSVKKENMGHEDLYNLYSGLKASDRASPLAKRRDKKSHRSRVEASQSAHLKEKSDQVKVEEDQEREKARKDAHTAELARWRLEQANAETLKKNEELAEEVEALKKEVEALRSKDAERQQVVADHAKAVRTHEELTDTLKESLTCGICFEILNDPHILSCGHVACKGCLASFFRTPGSLVHGIDLIAPAQDLSYHRKICHVCRATILRRPARLYHLRGVLQPLGIDPHMPTSSQADAERRPDHDPWRNIFPLERDEYRIEDRADGVDRCPECCGEIDYDRCENCNIEFSEPSGDEFGGSSLDGLDSEIGSIEGLEDNGSAAISLSSDDIGGLVVDSDADEDTEEGTDAEDLRPPRRIRLNVRLNHEGRDHERLAVPRRQRANDRVNRVRAPSADPIHISSDSEYERDLRRHREVLQQDRDRRRNRLQHYIDIAAEEDDALGDGGDYPDDPEESDEGGYGTEESYEDSFIDDGSVGEIEAGSDEDIGFGMYGGEEQAESGDGGGFSDDEVDSDIVRNARARRNAHRMRPAQPVGGNRRRQVVASSDDE